VTAFLDYDIDVDAPKPEHIRFLDSKVLPLIAGTITSTGRDAALFEVC
jgi:hypothetical protein